MELNQQDVQVLLEIIGKSSIQVEQYENVVRPIVNKLQVLSVKLQGKGVSTMQTNEEPQTDQAVAEDPAVQ